MQPVGIDPEWSLSAYVAGIPRPQGSKVTGMKKDGKFFVREASKYLKPWRNRVKLILEIERKRHGLGLISSPAHISCHFVFPKGIRFSYHQDVPDLDKLLRAILDACTGSVIADDSLFASCDAIKTCSGGKDAYVSILIYKFARNQPGNEQKGIGS
jgi:crossover junction endodeoxyribonuclease RusA